MNAPLPLSQIAAAPDAGALPPLITQPYLLVLFGPPFFVDASGRRWLEALWVKDLIEHTRYITHWTLAAPTVHGPPPQNAVAVDEVESLRNVRCVELPAPRNILVAFWCLPRTCAALWRALGSAELVQCVEDGVTGALVPPRDAPALASCIARLAREPARLAEMSAACVARARKLTHQEMHRKRWRLLVAKFPMLTRPA